VFDGSVRESFQGPCLSASARSTRPLSCWCTCGRSDPGVPETGSHQGTLPTHDRPVPGI